MGTIARAVSWSDVVVYVYSDHKDLSVSNIVGAVRSRRHGLFSRDEAFRDQISRQSSVNID